MFTRNERLRSLRTLITRKRSYYQVHAKATYYPNFTRIFIPEEPYYKLLPGIKYERSKIKRDEPKQNSENNLERSLRRTKKQIKDYTLCNKFDIFATFTFNCKSCNQNCQNNPCICDLNCKRFQPDNCKKIMSNWLKLQQKRKGQFPYIIVPEFHKDGKSLHFHALIKNYPGKILAVINSKTGEIKTQNGRQIYRIPSYRSGFTNVKKIDDTPESHARIGSYVSKYITKDMPLFSRKNRYWTSRNLKLPRTEDNPNNWYLKHKPIRAFGTENGCFYEYLNLTPKKS